VFAIFTFIGFKIPNVINDLSGRTAKKSIAKMRSDNEKSGDKSFGPSVKAKDRGTTTDKIRESEKLINKKTLTVKTDSDATDVLNSDATLPLTNNTTILSEETEVLSDNATTVLEESTTVLDEDTTVLCVESVPVSQQPNLKFEIIQNIVLIHTNEVI
jgi:hypothetical protein